MAFKISRQAGLNIGVTTAIWSITPFFVAFIERVFFKVSIGLYQIIGMLLIVIMTVLISLSDLFGPDAKEEKIDTTKKQSTPIYVAVLYAFIFPVVATCFTVSVKYIKILKMSANDWILGYNFAWGLVVSIMALAYWQKDEVEFRWKYLLQGSIAGTFTMVGALLATYALKVDGAPQGPTCAVCNSRIILLVIVDSLIQREVPPWM